MSDTTIVLYHYDKDTGIYIGSSVASPRPTGVGLPANCTLDTVPTNIPDGDCARWTGSTWEVIPIAQSATSYGYDADGISTGPLPAGQTVERSTDVAPPATTSGTVAVWDGTTWSLEEDHRSETVYYTSNAGAHIMTALGAIPEGCTTLIPPDYAVWQDGAWGQDVAQAKTAACDRIDTKAETLRNLVLTPGSGQMAAYQAKETQATALLADASPTSAKYPDIYNEVGITAGTASEVAKAVLAAAEMWRVFGRKVERARLAGKKAVSAAIDVAGVAAAEAVVAWPTA